MNWSWAILRQKNLVEQDLVQRNRLISIKLWFGESKWYQGIGKSLDSLESQSSLFVIVYKKGMLSNLGVASPFFRIPPPQWNWEWSDIISGFKIPIKKLEILWKNVTWLNWRNYWQVQKELRCKHDWIGVCLKAPSVVFFFRS